MSNDDGLLPPNPLNFAIRAEITSSGTYYLTVQGAGPTVSGSYALHARTVAVPGTSTMTAPVITPGAPVAARLEAGDEHFFKVELTEATDLWALAIGDTETNGRAPGLAGRAHPAKRFQQPPSAQGAVHPA